MKWNDNMIGFYKYVNEVKHSNESGIIEIDFDEALLSENENSKKVK